jgi:uncharacterized protein
MDKDALFGRAVVGVLAVAVLATLVDAAVSRRTPRTEPRVLTITADAYEEAEPDVVRISLGVKAVRPTPQQAATKVSQTVWGIAQRLTKLGVTQDAMETSELYLGEDARYDYRTGNYTKLGYKAYHWMRVTLKNENFNKLSAVVDAAVAGGTTSLSGLTWEMADDTKLRASALAKATDRARVKAEAMARAAGTSIAGVQRVSDQYSDPWFESAGERLGARYEMAPGAPGMAPSPPPAPSAESPGSPGMPSAEAPGRAPAEPNVPGKLRLNCHVQAAFLLR